VAHTEYDRRKIGKAQDGQIDRALELVIEVFKRYSLLVRGSCPDPLVPLEDYDVTSELKRIWP
jgi:hypothetical protein